MVGQEKTVPNGSNYPDHPATPNASQLARITLKQDETQGDMSAVDRNYPESNTVNSAKMERLCLKNMGTCQELR